MAPFKNIREHVLHSSFGKYTEFRGMSTAGNSDILSDVDRLGYPR